jgi:hypothetical protein
MYHDVVKRCGVLTHDISAVEFPHNVPCVSLTSSGTRRNTVFSPSEAPYLVVESVVSRSPAETLIEDKGHGRTFMNCSRSSLLR